MSSLTQAALFHILTLKNFIPNSNSKVIFSIYHFPTVQTTISEKTRTKAVCDTYFEKLSASSSSSLKLKILRVLIFFIWFAIILFSNRNLFCLPLFGGLYLNRCEKFWNKRIFIPDQGVYRVFLALHEKIWTLNYFIKNEEDIRAYNHKSSKLPFNFKWYGLKLKNLAWANNFKKAKSKLGFRTI